MNEKKLISTLAAIAFISLLIVVLPQTLKANDNPSLNKSRILQVTNQSILEQEIVSETESPVSQQVLYAENEIVGVVTDCFR